MPRTVLARPRSTALVSTRCLVLLLAAASSAGAQENREAALRRLSDPDPKARSAGLRALEGRLVGKEVLLVLPLLDDPDPYCRDFAALEVLAKVKDPEAVKVLLDRAPRASTTAGRLAAADLLIARGGGETVAPLLRLIGDRDPRVRETALDGLAEVGAGAPESLGLGPRLVLALGDREPGPRAAALEALVLIRHPEASSLLLKAVADPDPLFRSAAAGLLLREDTVEGAARLPALAADADWGVRLQVARAAPSLPGDPPVALLAGMLADSRLPVADAAHDALRRVSGLDLPPVEEDWLRWWEGRPATWRRPNSGPRGGARRTSVADWHGIGLRTGALLFVADLSGSMEQAAGAVDGRSRILVAREEMARTLNALADPVLADILVFMDRSERAVGRLVPLGGGARARMLRWFDGRHRGRQGDLGGALAAALADPDADTVLFLGDGAASTGDCLFRERILARIRQGLRLRPKTIHAVAFGARPRDRQFLEEVTGLTGGTCRER